MNLALPPRNKRRAGLCGGMPPNLAESGLARAQKQRPGRCSLRSEGYFVASTGFFGGIVRSPSFKFVLVGFLVIVIWSFFAIVWGLSNDRQSRASGVQSQVAQDWGGPQRLLGPYLIVPYTVKVYRIDSGKSVEMELTRHAVFLPDTLNIGGKAQTEKRRRSIYEVTVYQAALTVEGQFRVPDISLIEADPVTAIRWQDAILALGIKDVSGLKNNVQLETGGRKIDFEPSIGADADTSRSAYGIHAPLRQLAGAGGFNGGAPLSYKIELALKGSSSLYFTPAGRETTVSLESNWPHPSFAGFLPVSRTITANGFSSSWRVPHLARDVPQAWTAAQSQLIAGPVLRQGDGRKPVRARRFLFAGRACAKIRLPIRGGSLWRRLRA